jgi:hypothetical protein
MSKSEKMKALAAKMASKKKPNKPNPFIDIDDVKANKKKFGYDINMRKGRFISVKGTGK